MSEETAIFTPPLVILVAVAGKTWFCTGVIHRACALVAARSGPTQYVILSPSRDTNQAYPSHNNTLVLIHYFINYLESFVILVFPPDSSCFNSSFYYLLDYWSLLHIIRWKEQEIFKNTSPVTSDFPVRVAFFYWISPKPYVGDSLSSNKGDGKHILHFISIAVVVYKILLALPHSHWGLIHAFALVHLVCF